MKKKITAVLLSLAAACSAVQASAKADVNVKYVRDDVGYDYGSEYIWLAAEKDTDRLIPLSVAPFDGNTYAYLKGGGEIKLTKIKPAEFTDANKYSGDGLPEDVYYIDMYVDEMSARGVLAGYGDGTFKPGKTLTRAEMAAVFSRLFSIEPSDKPSCYQDVKEGNWFCGYIMALMDRGVFKQAEKFNPDEEVTREQLMAMTYRMLNDMGDAGDIGEYDFSKYRDIDKVSEFAREAYNNMLLNNYTPLMKVDCHDDMDTSDDEYFLEPQRSVTRYECAEFLYDFIRSFFRDNAPAIKRADAPDIEIPILDGSTSTYDITSNIFGSYYMNYQNYSDFPTAHSKTSNSYKRLIDGEVEMIFVPDPSEEIKNYAEDKGVKLKYIPIANEALIFFTGNLNKADNITTEQLRSIYVDNGIKNWSELGGEDAEFVPFCRNNDSGSHAQMEKFVLNGKSINEDIQKEHTSWMMSSILTEVDDFNRENPGKYAIGYSLYYYYFNNQMVLGPLDIKLMSVDGVNPSEETIADGTYPCTTNYYAVIRDESNEKIEKFAELMQGEYGQQIMKMSGMGAISD